MSYILEALKKSQLAEEGETAGLNPYRSAKRRGLPLWLVITLTAALLVNFLLFVWIYLLDAPPAQQANQPVDDPSEAAEVAPLATAAPATPAPQVVSTPQQVEPEPLTPAPAPAASSAQQPAPPQPAPAPRPPPVLQLRELSPAEQTVYNSFNYTSHIYTDEPSECAIVIDGERLQAGATFKGLQVVRITEGGVIFAETGGGRLRHVEVSVLEQWDRAS